MEKTCVVEHLLQMYQCCSALFSKEPLLTLLGYMANIEYAEQILKGSFKILPNTDPYVCDIINQLQL